MNCIDRLQPDAARRSAPLSHSNAVLPAGNKYKDRFASV
jgi:hypothetical protein